MTTRYTVALSKSKRTETVTERVEVEAASLREAQRAAAERWGERVRMVDRSEYEPA